MINLMEAMDLSNVVEELAENKVKCNINIDDRIIGTMIVEYTDEMVMNVSEIIILEEITNITVHEIANIMFKCAAECGLILNIKMKNRKAAEFFTF